MSKQETIKYFEDRIKWIDEHEKMFEISYCMILEREYCKDMLKKLKEEECREKCDQSKHCAKGCCVLEGFNPDTCVQREILSNINWEEEVHD